MAWRNVLGDILDATNTSMIPGRTVIVVFNDIAHYQDWADHSKPKSEDVRIIHATTSKLPLKIKGNPDTVCVAAIGFSQRLDYTDLRIKHYAEITP